MQEPSVAEMAAGGRCQPFEHEGRMYPVTPGCGPTFCATNTSKDEEREFFQLEDQRIAARTIQHFRIAKQKKQNFFIANGFRTPAAICPRVHSGCARFLYCSSTGLLRKIPLVDVPVVLGLTKKECVARSDKPHVPHVFPGEFLQYYPQDVEEIPLARMPYMPVDAPNVAWVRISPG